MAALIPCAVRVWMSEVKAGNSTEMNNYPSLDIDEANIQEAIAQFYQFFGRMVQLRNNIEQLALDFQTKNTILDQLEDIESELMCLMLVCVCLFEASIACASMCCVCVCAAFVLMTH